jgi:hypothetical protein
VHAMRQTPKRSCETPHNVCHQPWQKRVCRSNPVVMLITPERLGVPRSAGVVDLMLPNHVEHETINPSLNGDSFNVDEHETIKLSSDSFNIDDYQDKADADVLEWISTNIGKKVSYVATRRF